MNINLSKHKFQEQTSCFPNKLLELRNWTINSVQHPVIDITFNSTNRRPLRLRFICKDFDEYPPSIELLKENGEYLDPTEVPIGTAVFNRGKHPNTGRPFICSPGSLEYHTHQSHLNDNWENYRGKSSYNIGGLFTQFFNAWLKTRDGS